MIQQQGGHISRYWNVIRLSAHVCKPGWIPSISKIKKLRHDVHPIHSIEIGQSIEYIQFIQQILDEPN